MAPDWHRTYLSYGWSVRTVSGVIGQSVRVRAGTPNDAGSDRARTDTAKLLGAIASARRGAPVHLNEWTLYSLGPPGLLPPGAAV